MLSQFQRVGRDLFTRGLVSSHSGNLSIRRGEQLLITRRGSMLGYLQEQDLVETGVTQNNRATPLASTELALHRTIYQQTPALAVIHAHPPHAIALSLTEREFIPPDLEGSYLLQKVPVLGEGVMMKPDGLVDIIAQALKHNRIIIVKGHGIFATGQLLEEALHWTTALEMSCQVMCLLKSLNPALNSER